MYDDTFLIMLFAYGLSAIVSIIVYFIPTFVAFHRNHYYRWVILGVNVALGFTVIGWLLPLIWAVWPVQTHVSDVLRKDPVTNFEFDRNDGNNAVELIEKLSKLRKDDLISEDEFENSNKELLKRI